MDHEERRLGAMLAVLLRQLADDVERRSDRDLHKLVAKGSVRPKTKSKFPSDAAREITAKLSSFSTTEPATAYLTDLGLTKTELTEVARLLDLPISKQHNTQQLFDKVIEATVGFRTRSAAIRGDESTVRNSGENERFRSDGNAVTAAHEAPPAKNSRK